MIVNVHCHINSSEYDQKEKEHIISICKDKDIACLVTGTNLNDSKEAVAMSEKHNNIFAVVGIYPGEIKAVTETTYSELEALLRAKKVVAIGEIGLDYHYSKADSKEQKEVFIRQLELARKHKLPVVIHCRDAFLDTYNIVKDYKDVSKIFHCYSGSLEMAKRFIDVNSYLSFGGVITFKNAKTAKQVVKNIDIDHLLVETDCPYLTPEPFRGKQNKAYYVTYVVDKMAELKGKSKDFIEARTTINAKKVFGDKI